MSGGQNLAMRRLAIATVVSALGGCAAHLPIQKMDPTPILHENHLTGSWRDGICLFSGNIITYTTKTKPQGLLHQGQLVLDVTVLHSESLICSETFTVMLSPDRVTVTLGAQNIIDGIEMLGFMGNNRLVLANSYEVMLRPVNEDGGVEKASVDGKTLTLISKNGHEWQLDLSNPFSGWHIPYVE